jgi:hypothetical protein
VPLERFRVLGAAAVADAARLRACFGTLGGMVSEKNRVQKMRWGVVLIAKSGGQIRFRSPKLSKLLLALSNLHTTVQSNQSSQSIFALQLKLIVVFSKKNRGQLGLIELQYCNQFKQSSQATQSSKID